MRASHSASRGSNGRPAFTLIELLVVVAIIALLISILLPSLSAARASAKAVKCAAAERMVGVAVAAYTAEGGGAYPLAYGYPTDFDGTLDVAQQDRSKAHGYVHWSWFLFNRGEVNDQSFQCPEFPNGGAPRTNPGPDQEDWEQGQIDDTGNTAATPGSIADKQARRMAYAGNAAILPRNKFQQADGVPLQPGQRRFNRFVKPEEIEDAGRTIIATEYHNNWRLIADASESTGGLLLVKSHRPINPFYSISTGFDEYATPPAQDDYVYETASSPTDFGLVPKSEMDDGQSLIGGTSGKAELNAVGRHHPGGDRLGGTANFLYCDGHVERKTILQTMVDREWGRRYYSLTGNNNLNSILGYSYIKTRP